MKKLILAGALATLVASPVFAQAYYPAAGSGNEVPEPGNYASATNYWGQQHRGAASARAATGSIAPRDFRGAYAQEPAWNDGAVFSNGEYVGQDPDPNVRLELRRDSGNPAD